jgi:predicted ABC-type sugar transport system permease subunit
MVGTFIGELVVAVNNNGLMLLSEPAYVQFLFAGGVLRVAVTLSTGARRLLQMTRMGQP